jgi:hypothetical protein
MKWLMLMPVQHEGLPSLAHAKRIDFDFWARSWSQKPALDYTLLLGLSGFGAVGCTTNLIKQLHATIMLGGVSINPGGGSPMLRPHEQERAGFVHSLNSDRFEFNLHASVASKSGKSKPWLCRK